MSLLILKQKYLECALKTLNQSQMINSFQRIDEIKFLTLNIDTMQSENQIAKHALKSVTDQMFSATL